MRTIPPDVYNRLKARQQIGDYRPNHEVEVIERSAKTRGFIAEGTGSEDPTSSDYRPLKIIQGLGEQAIAHSNWVPTNEGRFICAYPQTIDGTNRVVLGYTDAEENFLSEPHYPIQETVVIEDITFYRARDCSLYKHDDGDLFMFVRDRWPDPGEEYGDMSARRDFAGSRIDCYVSASGNGYEMVGEAKVSDFVYYSTVQRNLPGYSDSRYQFWEINWNAGITYEPMRTSEGNFLLAGHLCESFYPTSRIWMSEDKFLTWKRVAGSRFFGHSAGFTKPVELPDGSIFSCVQWNSGNANLFLSETKGHSFFEIYNHPDYGTKSLRFISERSQSFNGSFLYDDHTGVVYRHSAGVYGGCGIHILENPTKERFMDPEAWEFIMYTHSNRQQWTRLYHTPKDRIAVHWGEFILGFTPPEGTKLRAKYIHISRSRTAASALNIVFDNKDGVLTPERSGSEYFKLLWMNNEIVVKQGYGNNLVQTFSGLIDSPRPRRNPDYAEIEVVARDYYKRCLDQTITHPETGAHAVHAVGAVESIFRQLAIWAGFSNDRIVTETTGMSVEKDFSWESYADAMQWLAEVVNFEIIVDEYGTIYFLRHHERGSDLAPDYVFREGEDIIRIDYEVDDAELYAEVVVFGRAENEEGEQVVLEARAPFGAVEYNQVLPQKILPIHSDLSTLAECQTLADRTVALMASKPRCADFAAIGVPYLQPGDRVRVIESSTTISEIYRIEEMDIMQEPEEGTLLMTLRTHHYGAPDPEAI